MVLFEVNKGKQGKPSENLLIKQIFNFIRLSRTFEMKLIAMQKIHVKIRKLKTMTRINEKYNQEKPSLSEGQNSAVCI